MQPPPRSRAARSGSGCTTERAWTTAPGSPRNWPSASLAEEMDRLRSQHGSELIDRGRFNEAAELFARVAWADKFSEFLTIPAYELI